MNLKSIGIFIGGVVATLLLGFVMAHMSSTKLGVKVLTDRQTFLNGFDVDATAPASIFGSAANFTGNITASGANSLATFTQGGGITASSSSGSTGTLLASDFATANMIDFTPTLQSITLTLPASSTLTSFVPNSGDERSVCIRNATTTVNKLITIAGGTGTLLKNATSSASSSVIPSDTDGSNYGCIRFVRKANTDIVGFLSSFKD